MPWNTKTQMGTTDQFSKQPLVQKHVEDSDFDLQMRTKAEEDPVVAAASIIAWATCSTNEEIGGFGWLPYSQGIGSQAKDVASELYRKYGESRMKEF